MLIPIIVCLDANCSLRGLSAFDLSVLRLHALFDDLSVGQIWMLIMCVWLVANDGIEISLLCEEIQIVQQIWNVARLATGPLMVWCRCVGIRALCSCLFAAFHDWADLLSLRELGFSNIVSEWVFTLPRDVCLLGILPLSLGMMAARFHNTFGLAMGSWILCGLLDLLRRNWTFRLGSRRFLLSTSLVWTLYRLFRVISIVLLLRAVTSCTRLALWRSVLLLVLHFDIRKVEWSTGLLVFNGLILLISAAVWLNLIDRLLSPAVCNWIWAWADELRPLWRVSRFLTVTAIFNCWTSVIWVNFTNHNFIIVSRRWSFIAFRPPLIFNLTPCTVVFMCPSCCSVCWLLSTMVLEYQLVLDWSCNSVFLLNIQLVDRIPCSYFRVFCTWVGCLLFILTSRCWSLLASRRSLPFL